MTMKSPIIVACSIMGTISLFFSQWMISVVVVEAFHSGSTYPLLPRRYCHHGLCDQPKDPLLVLCSTTRQTQFQKEESSPSSSSSLSSFSSISSSSLYQNHPQAIRRSDFLRGLPFLSTTAVASSMGILQYDPVVVCAFEGGVGGLGKTKPETGVRFFDDTYSIPIQNGQGIISAEILVNDNNLPVRVQFQTPWPLFPTTAGLEARDLRQPESAFVQVVPANDVPTKGDRSVLLEDKKLLQTIVLDTVLGQQGKYGAYATPTDVRFTFPNKNDLTFMTVTFTAYTPSMRESDRKLFIKIKEVNGAFIMLVTGTTNLRFSSQEKTFTKVIDSFEVVPAPKSSLR